MTLLFFCWLVALAAAVSFDAKPDHRDKVTREIVVGKHRYLCEFEFACAGGSLEAWDIDVLATSSYADGKQSTEVECVVMRLHPPSYLFFSEFQVTLKGPKHMEVVQSNVFDNDGELAQGTAYVLNKRKLRNVDGWRGIVNKLVVIARASE